MDYLGWFHGPWGLQLLRVARNDDEQGFFRGSPGNVELGPMETLNKSTTSFRRTPESSQIKHLDPGVRRGDNSFRASLLVIPPQSRIQFNQKLSSG